MRQHHPQPPRTPHPPRLPHPTRTRPLPETDLTSTQGFVVLPRRWVAERTFAWLMHSRRLARDYEALPASSEAMIRWSMVTRMGRRLARPRAADQH
ncbi:transposase [Streptomyces sp. NPDC057271]|uniref:transposase n=1 Tax=Streptomyces sp. NPDC057271 TaxID=3346078 RepID=UPI00362C3BB9